MKIASFLSKCLLIAFLVPPPAARAEEDLLLLTNEAEAPVAQEVSGRASAEEGVGNCVIRRGGLIFHISAHGVSGPAKCVAAGGVIYGNLCAFASVVRACEAE